MLITDAMEEFCLDCKVKKYSPRTIRNYRELLKLTADWLQKECGVNNQNPPARKRREIDYLFS